VKHKTNKGIALGFLLVFMLFGSLINSLFSQALPPLLNSTPSTELNQSSFSNLNGNLALALSTMDYPVTPGDTYTINYTGYEKQISIDAMVDSSYTLNLSYLGTFNTKGLNYIQLKNKVESKVSELYTNSSPNFVLRNISTFQIMVHTEIDEFPLTLWALTRVSDILKGYQNSNISMRRVGLIRDGKTQYLDMLNYNNLDTSANPRLRPGDELVLIKAQNSVRVSGAVLRQGSFEIKKGETLASVIQTYAMGLNHEANSERILLQRRGNLEQKDFYSKYLNLNTDADFALQEGDSLIVYTREDSFPVVFIIGALKNTLQLSSVQLAETTKISYRFLPGESLFGLVKANLGNFQNSADFANSYILRGEETIAVNLNEFIFRENPPENDIPLQALDTLVVPVQNYFVSLVGVVNVPGRYPYYPDRKADYYISLAGGIDRTKNPNGDYKIKDKFGKEKPQDSSLEPEDSIVVDPNSWNFSLSQITPTISFISAIVTIVYYTVLIINNIPTNASGSQ